MRRAAIYVFATLLTFSIGVASPALWEVCGILAKSGWVDLQRSWEPATFKCVYLEPSKELELIDLATPLPPSPQESSFPREAQSNKGHAPDY